MTSNSSKPSTQKIDTFVDKAWRGRSPQELLDAPVDALKGVSRGDATALTQALGIRTIRDLAGHWAVTRSRSILGQTEARVILRARAVEVPTAAPTEMTDLAELTEMLRRNSNTEASAVKRAWIGLQIYNTYIVKLPVTDADLTLVLGTSEIGSYEFVPSMKEAYQLLKDQAAQFLTVIYPAVVDIARAMHAFAEDARDPDGVFQYIKSVVADGNLSDALELLADRIGVAASNISKAAVVQEQLAGYKLHLIEGQGKLEGVSTAIEGNTRTSQETIDKLSGGENVLGSLAQVRKSLKDANDEYKQDVTIAATTVTYAWVLPGLPVGLIAAAVVAGVYGKRATDELDTIHRIEGQISGMVTELGVAVKTHNVAGLAHDSVASVLDATNRAIDFTTTMQNSWSQIKEEMEALHANLAATISTNATGDQALKSKVLVNKYVDSAVKKWNTLYPDLDVLVANAYITVGKDSDVAGMKELVESLTA
jgi:hypothetical protein